MPFSWLVTVSDKKGIIIASLRDSIFGEILSLSFRFDFVPGKRATLIAQDKVIHSCTKTCGQIRQASHINDKNENDETFVFKSPSPNGTLSGHYLTQGRSKVVTFDQTKPDWLIELNPCVECDVINRNSALVTECEISLQGNHLCVC